jgi:hypothetical protein
MGQADNAWLGRVIFPVFEGGVPVHAVGRTFRRRDRRARYLRPPGRGGRRHVYKCYTGTVAWAFLTEGPIDAIRLDQQNLPGLALLGKKLTREQRSAILNSVTTGVVVILDSDAWSDALDVEDKLGAYLKVETKYLWRGDVGSSTKATLRSFADSVKKRVLR